MFLIELWQCIYLNIVLCAFWKQIILFCFLRTEFHKLIDSSVEPFLIRNTWDGGKFGLLNCLDYRTYCVVHKLKSQNVINKSSVL